MDRAFLEDSLALAEKHITLGEQHLARQHEIIKTLDRGGHDTTMSVELLATLERSQTAHTADRDRLLGELAALNSAP
jgi:hypothetical protein